MYVFRLGNEKNSQETKFGGYGRYIFLYNLFFY